MPDCQTPLTDDDSIQVVMDRRFLTWFVNALPEGLTVSEYSPADDGNLETHMVLPSPALVREMECPLTGGCGACSMPRRFNGMGMRVCPDCGNKRCPHIWHHDYVCTQSNEPDQVPRYADGTAAGRLPHRPTHRANELRIHLCHAAVKLYLLAIFTLAVGVTLFAANALEVHLPGSTVHTQIKSPPDTSTLRNTMTLADKQRAGVLALCGHPSSAHA